MEPARQGPRDGHALLLTKLPLLQQQGRLSTLSLTSSKSTSPTFPHATPPPGVHSRNQKCLSGAVRIYNVVVLLASISSGPAAVICCRSNPGNIPGGESGDFCRDPKCLAHHNESQGTALYCKGQRCYFSQVQRVTSYLGHVKANFAAMQMFVVEFRFRAIKHRNNFALLLSSLCFGAQLKSVCVP